MSKPPEPCICGNTPQIVLFKSRAFLNQFTDVGIYCDKCNRVYYATPVGYSIALDETLTKSDAMSLCSQAWNDHPRQTKGYRPRDFELIETL